MEKNVEKLIQTGIKSVRTEMIINRKLIEAYANCSQSTIDYLTELYQTSSACTDSIVVELLTKENLSSQVLEEYLKRDLLGNINKLSFLFIFRYMETLKKYSERTSEYEKLYCSKNSIPGEHVMYLLNVYTDYLRNNKFENGMEKRNFLSLIVNYAETSPAIRQFFKGNTELASSLCTPELYYDKNQICNSVRHLADFKLNTAVKMFTPSIALYSKYGDKELENMILQIKLDLIATFAQCEKYGVELEIGDYTTSPDVLNFLHDAKKNAKKFVEKQNQLVKR